MRYRVRNNVPGVPAEPVCTSFLGDAVDRTETRAPENSGQGTLLIEWLDRLIALLMVAILLTLSWPVCMALWANAPAAPTPPTARSASPPPAAPAPDLHFYA
ncbi:MAG: hypothetical protein RMJ43_16360 [Chloroherpetonaceae bacterium]|nr:hypothetical protein [Chthonomonadaceae bacterium]MDW8209407.1 hypothetical protein [Chloroherpetonaceae bacterium]